LEWQRFFKEQGTQKWRKLVFCPSFILGGTIKTKGAHSLMTIEEHVMEEFQEYCSGDVRKAASKINKKHSQKK